MMQEHVSRIKIQVLKKIIYCIRVTYFKVKNAYIVFF